MATPKPVLTYLDARMLAEPVRLALFIGEVDFEDERIDYAEVARRRDAGLLPFGQVPVLTLKGEKLTQSGALLRWAGKQSDLLPASDELYCDSIECALADVRTLLRPLWYSNVLGRHPLTGSATAESMISLTEAQLEATASSLNDEILPLKFQALERNIKGDFFCGDNMTVCDISWYCICIGLLQNFYCPKVNADKVLRDCPKLVAIAFAVHDHPRVALWNRQHNYDEPFVHPRRP